MVPMLHFLCRAEKQHLDTWRNWTALFLLGWMNNLSYCVVLAGAQSLADTFNQGSLIGLLAWADVGFGVISRTVNILYGEAWTIASRINIVVVILILGLSGVATSQYVSFWMSFFAICFIGGSCSLGRFLLLPKFCPHRGLFVVCISQLFFFCVFF